MVRSMFAGVSGLRAHQSKMDIIGNNIANVNTYGFKAGRATFKDAFYQTMKPASSPGAGYGGGNPSQVGYGSQIGSVDILYTRGSYAPTDFPTDVMIDGQGFFLVGPAKYDAAGVLIGVDPADPTSLNLTRVGNFKFDEDGRLVDSNRNYVYGYEGVFVPFKAGDDTATPPVPDVPAHYAVPDPLPADAKLVPLTIQNIITNPNAATAAVGTDRMKLASISIGEDGTVSGTYEGQNVVVGKIAVANVPNPNGLEMIGGSYYKANANTGKVTAELPGENSTGQLISGGLEMANVDLAKEFSEMITTQRGFQANTRIITVSDEMLQELVNLKR